tara:strand:+ start:135 stop:416 length:282 start_codon:yes stop_codon:yes gene_type:complete
MCFGVSSSVLLATWVRVDLGGVTGALLSVDILAQVFLFKKSDGEAMQAASSGKEPSLKLRLTHIHKYRHDLHLQVLLLQHTTAAHSTQCIFMV